MSERVHIPASPACGQWETLLADALDGLLKPGDEATFSAHMAICPACAALFDEARRGREWLEFLSPDPEVPAGLLEKILAQTGPGKTMEPRLAGNAGVALPMPPVWQKPGFMAYVRRFSEPRLMMTAAMAFFSIALTLNLTGIRLSSVRLSDLRPAAVRSYMERRITTASTPIVRYYDHLRFVYEVQTRVREFQRSTEGNDQGGGDKQKNASPSAPGESHRGPAGKDGGSRRNPPQESLSPNGKNFDMLESALTFSDGYAHSGGSTTARRERSTTWIA